MPDRTRVAVVCLHLSAALYIAVGLLVFWLTHDPEMGGESELRARFGVIGLVVCLALFVGIEVVAAGLRRRRFWAWVAGLCIFGLYVPSLFLPLGALGLWGLLAPGSRASFRAQGGDTTV